MCACVCVCVRVCVRAHGLSQNNKKKYKSLGRAAQVEKIIIKGFMRVLKCLASQSSGLKEGESKRKKVICSHRYMQALALVRDTDTS